MTARMAAWSGRRLRKACGLASGVAVGVCALFPLAAHAQTLTRDLLSPVRGRFVAPQDLPLRRTPEAANSMAPSRIGKTPTYGVAAAAGASDTGYDSLNRNRKVRKPYPGARKRKPLGPGNVAPILPPPPLTIVPSSLAAKPPVPASIAGNAPGQPTRRRLRLDTDPFGAVGDYVGSFLVKSAVEVSAGYDTNPGRFTAPRGSAFYVIAPELLAASDWTRHSLVADLRGSFTGYGSTFPPPNPGDCSCDPTLPVISSVPTVIDRPDINGKVAGRLDMSHDTRILGEARLRLATDNPGSPNIQAGLKKYPLFAATGATLGAEQDFNRLQIALKGTIDRVAYQDSLLTNGVSTTNVDRNFDQYGGVARASYELLPGLKPFGEVGGDTRIHDRNVDRSGYQRDSRSTYAKAGTTFELTRLLTGEIGVGYGLRSYQDPRLNDLAGLLTSASLVWVMSPLTRVKVASISSLEETTLAGASGVLVRTYTAQVDHDFRRWLTATGRFTYGTLDYQGGGRLDTLYSISGDLVYRLNRTYQIKAQIRRDLLHSSLPGYSTASTAAMLGVRLQN